MFLLSQYYTTTYCIWTLQKMHINEYPCRYEASVKQTMMYDVSTTMLYRKVILILGPGLMRRILVWILPQVQDQSLNLAVHLQSRMLSLCYGCPYSQTNKKWNIHTYLGKYTLMTEIRRDCYPLCMNNIQRGLATSDETWLTEHSSTPK